MKLIQQIKRGKVSTARDEEFVNHVRYLQEVETYCSLKYAIKRADVGLLQRLLPRFLLYFHGSGATNYAREMLKRAILVNGLVNLRGQEDSWLEIDRHNEHLNLELKEILYACHTGNGGSAGHGSSTVLAKVAVLPP
jgi:uncharacterized protein DUF6589